MKKLGFLLVGCLHFFVCLGQKQISRAQQIWVGYINQLRLSKSLSITADAHLRTKEHFFTNFSTAVLRAGLIFHVTENLNASAGYAYFHYYPTDDHQHVAQPEHRPYQQVQWNSNCSKLKLQQRIRLEERFRKKIKNEFELGDGYNFNFRLRYQGILSYPLSRSSINRFSVYGGDEVLLNFGKRIIYNSFDHNRIHLGITYHPDKDDQLQIGYLYIFQEQSAANQYRRVHVVRIYYTHALDLRKKA